MRKVTMEEYRRSNTVTPEIISEWNSAGVLGGILARITERNNARISGWVLAGCFGWIPVVIPADILEDISNGIPGEIAEYTSQ